MFYIVEEHSQLQLLTNLSLKRCYVEVIPLNNNYHSKLNSICLVYLREIESDKGYIIPVDHEEGLNLKTNDIRGVLGSIEQLYVLDKKLFLYYFSHKNIVDISLLYSLNEYENLELPNPSRYYTNMYHTHGTKYDLNKIIPIAIHYQNCEENYATIVRVIKRYKNFLEDPSWRFYNELYVGVFYLIEEQGIRYQYGNFEEIFKPQHLPYSVINDIIYTSYNLHNTTSRPSNAFNSINFVAIPHKEPFRRAFIPKNDYLLEFDFDGYHIRLIADLVGYEFTSESVHTQLGRLYFDKEELTEEEYRQSKNNTFQILYGGVPDKWRYIEFFDRVHYYIKSLWQEFTEKGEIRCPISNKKFSSALGDMHSQKLFNYVIQNLETSRNVLILKEALQLLRTKQTKVILYTYDAILLDFSKQDGKDLLFQLESILSENSKFPVKAKYGKDYLLTN
jgi:hypothetical protein